MGRKRIAPKPKQHRPDAEDEEKQEGEVELPPGGRVGLEDHLVQAFAAGLQRLFD